MAKNAILMIFDLYSDLEIAPFAGQGGPLIWYSKWAMVKGSDMAIFVCYTLSLVEMHRKTVENAIMVTFDLHSDLEMTLNKHYLQGKVAL